MEVTYHSDFFHSLSVLESFQIGRLAYKYNT